MSKKHNFIIQKLKVNTLPSKIYKLRQTKLSQFVYFLREREEIFFTHFGL